MQFLQQNQKGFTLIEMIFTIVLLAIISVVVGRVLFQSFQTFQTSQNILETDWQGLILLEKVANDIHNIRSISDITIATATQLSFVDINGTSVNYQYSGTNILRNSQLLATDVGAFSFAYTDKNGITTATIANIRNISVSASITYNNLTQSFLTAAALRCVF